MSKFKCVGMRVAQSDDGVTVTQMARRQLVYEHGANIMELFKSNEIQSSGRVLSTIYWPEKPCWLDGRALAPEESVKVREDISEALLALDCDTIFRREQDSEILQS